jgi:hypothetical protein
LPLGGVIQYDLAANQKEVQKADDLDTILIHVVCKLKKQPFDEWDDMLEYMNITQSNTRGELKWMLNMPSKKRFFVGLFSYQYFELASKSLDPHYFDCMSKTFWSVSFNILILCD